MKQKNRIRYIMRSYYNSSMCVTEYVTLLQASTNISNFANDRTLSSDLEIKADNREG